VIRRVAYLSIHTSPLAAPGSGDAGGMNVYVHELAQTMAGRGVQVDVFTRGRRAAEVEVVPGYRVVQVPAGEVASAGDDALAAAVGDFAEGVARWVVRHRASYDILHSHYWLSGWAGLLLHEVLRVPLAISFHTLGRVKDANRRADEAPAGLLRLAAETEVIARAGCVIASTPTEAEQLIEHYGANPERLCTSPPGVDHGVFRPGSRAEARAALDLPAEEPLVLFVGRLQPLKGPDVALAAFARLASSWPAARLLMVGGRGSRAAPRRRDGRPHRASALPSSGAPRRARRLLPGRRCAGGAFPQRVLWAGGGRGPGVRPARGRRGGGRSEPRCGRRGVGDPGFGMGPGGLRRRSPPYRRRSGACRSSLRRGRGPGGTVLLAGDGRPPVGAVLGDRRALSAPRPGAAAAERETNP
jgi:hypothetical protein